MVAGGEVTKGCVTGGEVTKGCVTADDVTTGCVTGDDVVGGAVDSAVAATVTTGWAAVVETDATVVVVDAAEAVSRGIVGADVEGDPQPAPNTTIATPVRIRSRNVMFAPPPVPALAGYSQNSTPQKPRTPGNFKF
ncbi:MAG: hypothetical protein QOF30_326 [Acidimicrobiaceae bacterium]|nr:hypothetical protein [Acidimicrobiaceae bacterium]